MRILFAGSPAIAVPSLKAIAALASAYGGSPRGGGDFTLAGLLTNADSPRGRSGRPEPTDCAAALTGLRGDAVPILKPEKLDAGLREQAAALKPDLLVSFAYGRIFGPKFLALFPLGGINIHPSLLPQYRGPAPIPAAIINRDTSTGITIQRLALEMDSGDILARETMPLNGRETTAELSETMALKAARMLPDLLVGIASGTVNAGPQDHSAATYCSLITRDDGLIDWNLGAADIDARIRAFTPWPLSFTAHGDRRLIILKAGVYGGTPGQYGSISPGVVLGKDNDMGILIQTGAGVLAVRELQYRTKKALDWKAFQNGTRNFIGTRLG